MSDVRFFWLCIALVTGYAVLWWVTSREPKSQRQKIQAGIRPFYEKLAGFQHSFESAATLDDIAGQVPEFDRTLNDAGRWIAENMSSAAFQKFKNPDCGSFVWKWPGDEKSAERSKIVVLNRARLDVLDTFLATDGYDGEAPSLSQRLSKRISKWKSGNPSSIAS